MYKKFIAIMMILAMIVVSTFLASANNSVVITEEQILENQKESVETNTKLINYFLNNSKYRSGTVENVADTYPEYYGGSYINKNGDLVVLMTDQYSSNEKIDEIIGNAKVEVCKNSYNSLVDTISNINQKISESKTKNLSTNTSDSVDYYDDITGSALIDKNNTVEVYIKDLNEEKTKWFFEKVDDSDSIVLKPFVGNITKEVNLPGQKVYRGSITFSAAFRVKRYNDTGTHYGFITCAHGNSLNNSVYGNGDQKLGTVQLRKYGGAYDVSYVEMPSQNLFGNAISGSSYTLGSTNDYVYAPTSGQIVYLYAQYHKGSSGKITSTYVSFNDQGTMFSGLIGANYASEPGDSGGLICNSTTDNYNTYGAMGVHRGTYGSYKVFTSAMNIINNWHFQRY